MCGWAEEIGCVYGEGFNDIQRLHHSFAVNDPKPVDRDRAISMHCFESRCCGKRALGSIGICVKVDCCRVRVYLAAKFSTCLGCFTSQEA